MNKKIDIYTLLGLIKDGKAPKKIKVFSKTFELIENTNVIKNMYVDKDGDGLFDEYWWSLNDEVEILNKEDEFIDIESFGIHYSWDYIDYKNIEELKKYVNKDFQNIFDTLDKLIKNQKKIITALKENK